MTALALAIADWSGSTKVKVDLESHGRADLFTDVDLSRTTGWFTAIYPLLLSGMDAAGLNDNGNFGDSIIRVKEALRAVPRDGVGYGLLRYLHSDAGVRRAMERVGGAEVCFNYLGRLADTRREANALLRLAPEQVTGKHGADAARFYILEVDGYLQQNDQLQVEWTYNQRFHREFTIARLAENFKRYLLGITEHCLKQTATRFTPADFPLAKLNQSALDDLQRRYRHIEDIYPLSFTQEGMLFHSLFAPQSGVYFEQLVYRLRAEVDLACFKKAWQIVISRHCILRTGFVWKGLDNPMQVVSADAAIDWTEQRWGLGEQVPDDERLEQWLQQDRRRGFDLSNAPLCRFGLFKLRCGGYRFLISHHHLLLDGWSIMLIIKDVLAIYRELVSGKAAIAVPVPPYREYIKWQHNSQTVAQAYWRRELRGIEEPTPLPLAKARTNAAEAYSIEHSRINLPGQDTRELEQFARRNRVTMSAVVQGAWALLLHRYTQQNECLFGVTVSGRTAPLTGIESMVGLFIGTVPVRISCADNLTVKDWLHSIQTKHLQSEQHAHISLAEIHRQSEIAGDIALFDSIVVYENYPVELAESDALELKYEFSREKTNFPLTLVVGINEAVKDRQLQLDFSYSRECYDERAIAQIGRHLQNILRNIARGGERRLNGIQLLSQAEWSRQVYQYNQTDRHFFQGCVQELFENRVRQSTELPAVYYKGESLTYTELNIRANKLAHFLCEWGVGPETSVALCLNRSLDLLVSILAVLKAGGAYIPIDPDYPEERIAFMLSDSKAGVLIHNAETGFNVSTASRSLFLDREKPLIESRSVDNPQVRVTPSNLAYIIYTSGSTGKPKGVMIEHRALSNYLDYGRSAYGSGIDSPVNSAVHTSIGFDATITSLFLPLISGGSVTLIEEENELDALARAIRQNNNLDLLKLTPVHLELLGKALAAQTTVNVDTLVVGGEALNGSALKFWQQNSPNTRIINEYGPTETVVGCCTYEIKTSDSPDKSVPIGKPIANTQLYILDSDLNPVPAGVAGELYIGGEGVARGYLNRPELTAERFLTDPFRSNASHTAAGNRMYKTGDLVRFLPNEDIEFIGRIDQQIKLRGFRIELGEIEASLSGCELIRDAVVVFHKSTDYEEQRLVAFCVLNEGKKEDSEVIRDYLMRGLPAYMLPGQFVFLQAFPLTVNGKVDRVALQVPGIACETAATFVEAESETQRQLCGIWRDVLELKRVGVHDNFFALGGHSLKATRIISKIDKVFAVAVPLRTLFEKPSVEALATVIDTMRSSEQPPRKTAIKKISRSERRSANSASENV